MERVEWNGFLHDQELDFAKDILQAQGITNCVALCNLSENDIASKFGESGLSLKELLRLQAVVARLKGLLQFLGRILYRIPYSILCVLPEHCCVAASTQTETR